jgi:hypothetical protein
MISCFPSSKSLKEGHSDGLEIELEEVFHLDLTEYEGASEPVAPTSSDGRNSCAIALHLPLRAWSGWVAVETSPAVERGADFDFR